MSMTAALQELTHAFSDLVSQHLVVARLELQEDARFIGARVGIIAALAPLILVGYGFVCAALALGLATWLPLWAAVLIIGVVNITGGLLGILKAAQQLQGRRVMEETMHAAEATAALAKKPGATP